MGKFLTTQVISETPISAINILFALVMIMGVRLGIEPIARAGELLLPWLFFLLIILVVFIAPLIKLENVQPILETDPKSLVHTVLNFISASSLAAIVLLMVFPAYVKRLQKASKVFLIGHLIGGFVISIITFLSIPVLGADQSAGQMFPSYEFATKINVGNFIQRIEAVLAVMWFISLFFKVTLYFYATVLGTAQLLKLEDYRTLTLPLGMIVISLSTFAFPNVIYQQKFDSETITSYEVILGLLLPLLMIAVSVYRKKVQVGKKS